MAASRRQAARRCVAAAPAANREGNRDRSGGSSSSSSSGPGLYTALLPLQAAPAANGGTAAGDRGIDAAAVAAKRSPAFPARRCST
ncbi:MAG: hypothetical protein U1F67_25085 [Rubrivivax sp.]